LLAAFSHGSSGHDPAADEMSNDNGATSGLALPALRET
jgi:hypothetical protein